MQSLSSDTSLSRDLVADPDPNLGRGQQDNRCIRATHDMMHDDDAG